MRSTDCSIDSRFRSGPRRSCAAWRRRRHVPVRRRPRSSAPQSTCCPSGKSIHPRKPSMKELSSNGVFRAPLAHRMRMTTAGSLAVARLSDKVIADHKRNSTVVTAICRDNEHRSSEQRQTARCHCGCPGGTRSGSRQAFSRLRTFLWFATAVAGFTVRTELLGVTSLVRALKLEARFYNKLVDRFTAPPCSSTGSPRAVDPDGAAPVPPAAAHQRPVYRGRRRPQGPKARP